MANTKKPQTNRNIFPQKANPVKTNKSHGGVGQDNNALRRVRTGSTQLVIPYIPARTRPMYTKFARAILLMGKIAYD